MSLMSIHTTIWSTPRPGRPNRLGPTSRLAREVLDIDSTPAFLGWNLDNHYINPVVKPRKPNVFERAQRLALTGR